MLIKISTLLTLLLMLTCSGNNSSRDDDDTTPIRSGKELEQISFKFFDQNPSVDDAGQVIAFSSGRSTDESLVEKIYIVDWSGDEPGDPERLTDGDDDWGFERNPMVSPDGAWVLFQSSQVVDSQSTTQWVVAKVDGGSGVTVSTSTSAEHFGFSHDSTLVYWLDDSGLQFADLTTSFDGGEFTATERALPEELTDVSAITSVVAPTSGYLLILSASDGVQTFAFTGLGAVASGTFTAIDRGDHDNARFYLGRSDQLFFANDVGGLKVQHFGTETEKERLVSVSSRVASQTFGSATISEPESPISLDVRSLSMGIEDLVWLGRKHFLCSGGKTVLYAVGLHWNMFDWSEGQSAYLYWTGSKWNVAETLCGQSGTRNSQISNVTASRSGTTQRLFFQSRFSTARDAKCKYTRSADPEIYGFEVSEDDTTVYQLSANSADLEDLCDE